MTTLALKQNNQVQRPLMERILHVPWATGDDARRRRLLNILLVAIFVLSVLIVISSLFQLVASGLTEAERETNQLGLISSIIMLGVVLILYAMNRYFKRYNLAGVLLVGLLTLAIAGSDTPQELTQGRSIFFFTLPILIAGAVLRPRATFIAATFVLVPFVALTADPLYRLNFFAVTGFYIVALLAWLASSSLENALNDLRVINAELDQRVEQRTIELRDALDNVQRESRKNEAILASIADGVVVFDAKGRATIANDASSKLLDRSNTDIIGSTISTLTGEQMGFNSLETLVTSRKIELGERTLSVSVAPVQIENQVSKELVAVFRDFTREEQLNKMKDTFVSMASHELRTPLNAIIGYGDMLKEKVYGDMNDEQDNLVGRMMANTKRMLSLVNNMLDQAQIAVGKLSLNIQPFPVTTMIEEVDSIMSVLAKTKGLEFKISKSDDVPQTLMGDRERLVQIIINLTGNAVKFTDKGTIEVKVTRADQDKWQIVVADTGRGIPKHMLETVFQPFEQVDDVHTRNVGGTGLGLSIVRLLTDLMGGTVRLESTVGVGSTFTITLPMKVKEEEPVKS